MVCVTYAGLSLGVFYTSRAMDLGLSVIDAASSPVGHNGARHLAPPVSSMSTPASSESGAQKFQLGETLPVVPAGIVRRILCGDYIDMAELSEKTLNWS